MMCEEVASAQALDSCQEVSVRISGPAFRHYRIIIVLLLDYDECNLEKPSKELRTYLYDSVCTDVYIIRIDIRI